jgi:hypothetical protein
MYSGIVGGFSTLVDTQLPGFDAAPRRVVAALEKLTLHLRLSTPLLNSSTCYFLTNVFISKGPNVIVIDTILQIIT